MNFIASIATQETDAVIKEREIQKGRLARKNGLDESACPWDYNSIVGQWWQYGWSMEGERYISSTRHDFLA